jgi:hypothetical protein
MSSLNNITSLLFSEFSKTGKTVAVHTEGNYLVIKVGTADTRIMNWESMTPESILEVAKSLVIRENYKGNVLLHG